MEYPFEDSDILSCYTWDDAIEDGTFVRVPDDITHKYGIRYPTAITASVSELCAYGLHLDRQGQPETEQGEKDGREYVARVGYVIRHFVLAIKESANQGNRVRFTVETYWTDPAGPETLIAVCEARGPKNPEPIITIMLPEDD